MSDAHTATIIIIFLSYIGLKTDKFNDLIKNKANEAHQQVKLEIRGNKNNPFRCERDDTMTWHDTYDKDEPDFADDNGYCIFDPELAKGCQAVDDKRCWDHIADPTIKYCKGGCGGNIGSKNNREYCMGCYDRFVVNPTTIEE